MFPHRMIIGPDVQLQATQQRYSKGRAKYPSQNRERHPENPTAPLFRAKLCTMIAKRRRENINYWQIMCIHLHTTPLASDQGPGTVTGAADYCLSLS